MTVFTQPQPSFICDTETERNTGWPDGSIIYCKDTDKLYVIDAGVFKFIGPGADTAAVWGAITGTLSNQDDLNTALGGKAATSHAHAPGDVTGTAVITNDSRLSDARTPLTHSHVAGDVTGTAVVTNDSRLSDARTPLTHSHNPTDITGTAVVTADSRLSDARQLAAGTDKTKLDGIASGAEVNVNADWNASSGDAQILNKPTILVIDGLAKITVGTSTPVGPSVGDLWIDTN